MNKFKEMMKDNTFIRGSFFILFNAIILYAAYFLIKNIGSVSSGLGSVLATLLNAFWPLIIGLILAYLLNPLSELIDEKIMSKAIKLPDDPIKAEKKKNTRHFISVILTFVLVIAAVVAIIYGFAVMIIGKVVLSSISETAQDLFAGVIGYEHSFKSWIAQNVPEGVIAEKLTDLTNAIMGWIGENVNASSVISFFTGIGSNIVDIVIGTIISIYLMKDKQFFLGLWRKFLHLVLPQKGNAVLTETLSEVNGVLSKFIRGALLDALFIAILSSIGLSIMDLEAAVFIGVFAGICNVIPYFGPVMGMVPAFLMGWATGGFWHGALAVIILLVIQQIDANLIYPKIVGTSTGLHPLMVLLAVSVFGYFWGILGMLLAVPIAGVIQVFVVKWATGKERRIEERAE
ncbi:MAG: AI-2E family transporter [Clostridiales bacterium]|nr:AI-2E family transporter [Clostridiales bacterium]